ncbi:MAG TPA: excinuclease [Treponema sp.]|nr:excinuclease [Treponema sp.]
MYGAKGMGQIIIKGIQTNNLKNIDVTIQKNALNLIIGPSGSGKSSLAYGTIGKIGLQEYLSMFFDEMNDPSYRVSEYQNMSATVPIKQTNYNSNVKSTIGTYFCFSSKIIALYASLLGMDEHFFVLNREENVCPVCHGLGTVRQMDLSKILDYKKTIAENPFKCWQRRNDFFTKILIKFCEEKKIDINTKIEDLSAADLNMLLNGESKGKFKINYTHGKFKAVRTTKYFGLFTQTSMIQKDFNLPDSYYSDLKCKACNGLKYSEKHLEFKLNGLSIGEFMNTSFSDLTPFFDKIRKKKLNAETERLINPICVFLNKAIELNLGYLSFTRTIPSLSGGELQRLRLIQVLCTQLTDLILIFDEPLAGLSGEEKEAVFKNITRLSKKHTLIVVDHSRKFISSADNIIALGEKSGELGGYLINAQKYIDSQVFPTGIATVTPKDFINVKLKQEIYGYAGADVKIAKKSLNLVTGYSGVGKSTLLREYFPRFFDEYLYINQKPVAGNVNSNVGTLLDISSRIFNLFAKKFEKPKSFFSNSSGNEGCCPACSGSGYNIYANEKFTCKECDGTGFNQALKKYKIADKNLFDIWGMTVSDAMTFFDTLDKKIMSHISVANQLSLGHLRIGQATASLSGGENVRIKLLKLADSQADVIGVDEPFKGLNITEIWQILNFLIEKRDSGKTIVVVDHTENVEKFFDYHIGLEIKNKMITGKVL